MNKIRFSRSSAPESRQLVIKEVVTEVCYNVQSTVDTKNNLPIDYDLTNTNDKRALTKMVKNAIDIVGNNTFNAIFDKGGCLTFKLENGNYGGAIVLESDKSSEFGFGYNLVAITRINSKVQPTVNDFVASELLIVNFSPKTIEKARKQIIWFQPTHYKKRYSNIYSFVGSLEIK